MLRRICPQDVRIFNERFLVSVLIFLIVEKEPSPVCHVQALI
jgi:hypothetical protein